METEKEATAVAEPTTPTMEQELATTKEALTKATADLELATHKAKAEEQNVSRKDRQLKEVQARQTEMAELKNTVGVLTTMMADLVDRGEYEESTPKRKKSEEYLSQLKTETPKEPSLPVGFIQAANEADRLAKSEGLEIGKSKELDKAYRLFRADEDGDAGLEEVKRVVDEIRKAKEEPQKKKTLDEKLSELTEEELDEVDRRRMEAKGTLHTDAGISSGKGMSRSEAFKKYADGNMTDADAKKHGLF